MTHLTVRHGTLLLTWVRDLPGGMALMESANQRMGGRSWWLRLPDGSVRSTVTGTKGSVLRLAAKLQEGR